jgi:hypothetical protein
VQPGETQPNDTLRDMPAAGLPPPAGMPPAPASEGDDRKKIGAQFASYPAVFPRMGRPETTVGRAANSWPRR